MAIDATLSRQRPCTVRRRPGSSERHQDLAVERPCARSLPGCASGDQRGRLLDEEIVELVALLPADDQDIAESASRQEGDVAALPLDHDVRAEGGPVHRLGEIGPSRPAPATSSRSALHARPRRVVQGWSGACR